MKVLITGAAGFVGTNLAMSFLNDEIEVIGLDSLVRGGTELNLRELLKKSHFDFRKKEIEDMAEIILRERPDLVYHLAAQVAVTSSVESPSRDFAINAKGSLDVALASHKVGSRVIYTSTNKVFGDGVNKVPLKEFEKRYDFDGVFEKKGIPEEFSIDASSHTPYGVSKLVGDLYVREYGGVANRCSCMYGPFQHGIVDQGWLSHVAQKAIKGEPIVIYGDGKQIRDVLHSKDVVRLLRAEGQALLDGPDIRGEVFNVGGGYDNTISLLELCEKWGIPAERMRFDGWRPHDQKVFYCDTSKSNGVFGWKPEVSLNDGIRELYDWTAENTKG